MHHPFWRNRVVLNPLDQQLVCATPSVGNSEETRSSQRLIRDLVARGAFPLEQPLAFLNVTPSQMVCAERPCAPRKAKKIRTRETCCSKRARSVLVCRMSIEYPLNLCAKIRQTRG